MPFSGLAAAARHAATTATTAAGLTAAGAVTIPEPAIDNPVYALLAALLACVQDALAATPAGAPAVACVVPGQVAVDSCACGMTAATATRIYPSRSLPTDASGDPAQDVCFPPYTAVDLTVTVLRCAPGPDRSGQAPGCAQLAAAAAVWRTDALTVLTAVACCLADLADRGRVEQYGLGEVAAVGPDGGCVGVALSATVALCTPGCPGDGG